MNLRPLFISIMAISSAHAVVTPIKSLDRFQRTLINEPFVVAYVYQDAQACDKAERQERKQLINNNHAVLKALSRDGRYQAAGLNFIQANISKDALSDLKQEYQLSDNDSLLLFEKERTLSPSLTGKLHRADVEELIESKWHNKINDILKQQAEERKQRLAEMRANAIAWGTGPYWCWPYGFGGCGWNGCWAPCRPYVGFNVGFGGCC